MKKVLGFISILFVFCTLVGNVYGSEEKKNTDPVKTPKFGGTVRYVVQSPGASLGYPPEAAPNNAMWTNFVCFEGLLREKTNGELVPWLATSYEVADDLRSITLTLRKGIQFHDGSDFNAEAVKWNLDNVLASGAKGLWESIDMVDDYTVRINLKGWDNSVLSELGADYAQWMASKAAFDKNGLDWVRKNPVGTGPFKFVSFDRDVGCKTVRNPNYWRKDEQGNQLPYLDAVEFVYISDQVTQVTAAQAGEVDMVFINPNKTASDLRNIGFKLEQTFHDTDVLMPDSLNEDSPWSNQLVREAAEYAIDREAIAKAFGYGFLKAPYQIPGPSIPAYDPEFALGRHYNVEKAKQLMKKAGYADGFKTRLIGGFHYNKDIVAAIQAYLAEIGIIAEIEVPEMSKFASEYIFGKWKNALLYTGMPGRVNFNSSFNFLYAPNYVGFPSWKRTPEYLAAYERSISSPTPDISLMRACTDIWTKQASIIPIVQSGNGIAYKSYIMNTGTTETSTPVWLPEQTWINK